MHPQQIVTVDEIEQAFSFIVKCLRAKYKSDSVPITDDYYWIILEENERCNVYSEPTSLGIGQFSEDLYFFRRALADKALLDTYLLTKLLPILQNYVDRPFGVEESK